MGILRADVVSHSSLEPTGSVLFDGTTDMITIPSDDSFAFGTADWSVEGWFYFTDLTGQQTLVGDTYGATAGWYLYKQSNNRLGVYYSSLIVDGVTELEANRWYHLAFIRNSGVTSIYIDGVLDKSATDTTNATITQYYIADTAGTSSGELFGYISNLRITRTAVYKQNFTVPKFELKNIPGTILLCCQSSSSTTEAAVSVPGTLTTSGDPTATTFAPDLKKDIIDIGTTFEDNTKFDTLSYMVPPGGTTTQSNRGRGLISGGTTPIHAEIDYIQIQSQGNSTDFGSLSATRFGHNGCASATRGLFGGGAEPTIRNIIEYVTIATTSNVTDFGDLTVARRDVGSLSNQTRGIWAGGSTPTIKDEIDYVTIASTGNAADFGNLTAATIATSGCCASSTRGLIGGGGTPSAVNTIEYITIASTGNAADFGDLTRTAFSLSCVSNSTRGVWANGGTNTIDYVTIASTGNAADFGDTTLVRAQCTASLSNSIRGVFAGGYQPSPTSADTNVIDFIEIASIGNAMDFGDINRVGDTGNRENGGCSDSHGGIS